MNCGLHIHNISSLKEKSWFLVPPDAPTRSEFVSEQNPFTMKNQIDVELTPKFKKFLANLNDALAKTKILARLKRLQFQGNWGDKASVGDGVIELRIDHGPGYRVYCKQIGGAVVIILGGGIKNGQQADIDAAKADAKAL